MSTTRDLAGGAAAAISKLFGREADATPAADRPAPDTSTPSVVKTEAEWRAELDPAQFAVLRGHGTERAGTSPLDREKRAGRFACAGCGQPLFESGTKFDSGTGWPSFFKPLEGAVATSTDTAFFMRRTEVHCARCEGHLGHVFEDGPAPTGLRYCMNGVAMRFEPA